MLRRRGGRSGGPARPEAADRADTRLRWLLGSSAAANLGDGIGKVAVPLLAASITRDPVLIAGLSATAFLPWLLFAFVSGALVDRVDRRAAVRYANVARAVAVGTLAGMVLLDAVSIWLIYLVALAVGTAETIADSAANALIPAVVTKSGLESANGKLQSVEIVGQTFLGAPVAGITFAVFAAAPLLATAMCFAFAAVLLAGLPGRYRPTVLGPPANLRQQLGEGLRWLTGQRLLRQLVLIAGAIALTSELAQAILVLYALQDLGISAAVFGLFMLGGGVGGLLGAAVAPRLTRRLARHVVLTMAVLTSGAAFIGMALTRDPVPAGALFGLFAAAIVVVNVILGTLRHALVPERLFGRVIGAWRTVVFGAIPVGAVLGGLLARWLGTPAVFAISGVAQLAVAVFAWRVLTRHRDVVNTLDAEPAAA